MKRPVTATSNKVIREPQVPGEGKDGCPTLHARIVDRLREDILSAQLPEGTALRQDRLAQRYGASRIPVREALLQLEGEGLVRQKAHHGYTVSRLSLSEIAEEFDLRAMLEADLITRSIPRLKRAHITAAREVLDRLDGTKGEVVDVRRWGELNWDLHRILLEPAGRDRTMRIIHNLHRSGSRYVRMQMSMNENTKTAADLEHRRLLKACADRDIHEARRVMAEHILHARDELLAAFAKGDTRDLRG